MQKKNRPFRGKDFKLKGSFGGPFDPLVEPKTDGIMKHKRFINCGQEFMPGRLVTMHMAKLLLNFVCGHNPL